MPSSLLAIILATVVTLLCHLPVATVGNIPQTLISSNRLGLGDFSFSALQQVAVPAISIALLGMIESLLCGASAGRMANKSLDSNQELVAQGVGNLLLPFWRDSCYCSHCSYKCGHQIWRTNQISWHDPCSCLVAFHACFAPVMSQIPMLKHLQVF